jgi:hypothetical protein
MKLKIYSSARLLFSATLLLFFTMAYSHASYIAQTLSFDESDISPEENDLVLASFVAPPLTGLAKVIISWNLDLFSDWEVDDCLDNQDCEPGNLSWSLELGNLVSEIVLGPTSPNNGITNGTDDFQSGTSNVNWTGMTMFTGADLTGFVAGGLLYFDVLYEENGWFVEDVFFNAATVDIDYVVHESSVPAPATLALFGLGLAGLGWSRRKKA